MAIPLIVSTLLGQGLTVLAGAVASKGKVKLDLYEIIDLRMLSGLMGEMFSTEVSKLENRLIKNPNIDGYPDLCDVSKPGKKTAINSYSISSFLAYDDGGFEVKNTFGVKKSSCDAVAFFGNGLCQRFAGFFRVDLHLVLSAIDHDFGLCIQGQQSLGHRFFAMATGHAFNSENLVHDLAFR